MNVGDGISGHVAATGLPTCFPAAAGEPELDSSFDERLGCKIEQALCQQILGNKFFQHQTVFILTQELLAYNMKNF